MKGLLNFFKLVFSGPRSSEALQMACHLAMVAEPIVAQIDALVPKTNRTVAAITAAYEHYAVPVATQITDHPTSMANALMNLAVEVLARSIADPVAVNILTTAVSLAVTELHA